MKQFSTGTKGRKQAHMAACKEAIEAAAIAANQPQLAKEYIKELSPFSEPEDWQKWGHPNEVVQEFKEWLGKDNSSGPISNSSEPATNLRHDAGIITPAPRAKPAEKAQAEGNTDAVKILKLEGKLKIAGNIISTMLAKESLTEENINQLELIAEYIPFLKG